MARSVATDTPNACEYTKEGWFEGGLNWLERATGLDIDGDGDTGAQGHNNVRPPSPDRPPSPPWPSSAEPDATVTEPD